MSWVFDLSQSAIWICASFAFAAVGSGGAAYFFWSHRSYFRHQRNMLRMDLDAERARLAKSRILLELGTVVATASDLEKAGEMCLHSAMKISGADAAVLYFFDKRDEEVSVVAEQGLPNDIVRKLNSHLMAASSPHSIFDADVYFGSYKKYLIDHTLCAEDKIVAQGIAVLPLVRDSRASLCLQLFSYLRDEFDFETQKALMDMRILVGVSLERMLIAKALSENLALTNARFTAVESILENLGYEFRTFMQSIMGSAEILKESHLDPVQMYLANAIAHTGMEMNELLDHVMELSRMEDYTLDLVETEVDVRAMMTSVLSFFKQRASSKDVSVSLRVDSRVPYLVVCDGERIRQILLNLLGAAFRFSVQGSLLVAVTSEIGASNDIMLKFSISDTGVGISKAKLNQIFSLITNPLARHLGNVHQGAIALAVTKRLIELMGGEIEVEPGDTQGASFGFTVRARSAAQFFVADSEQENKGIEVVPVVEVTSQSQECLEVWNKPELLERLGGDAEVLTHLKALFNSTTPEKVVQLRQASVRRDFETLEKISHELKGVAQNLIMDDFLESIMALRESISERASDAALARRMQLVCDAFEKALAQEV